MRTAYVHQIHPYSLRYSDRNRFAGRDTKLKVLETQFNRAKLTRNKTLQTDLMKKIDAVYLQYLFV